MKKEKVGVWIIGALGSIATTVITGVLAMKKGLAQPAGLVTASEAFRGLNLAGIDDLEFGGCDLRTVRLREGAEHMVREARILSARITEELDEDFRNVESRIVRGTLCNCGPAIDGLAGCAESHRGAGTLRREIDRIREHLRAFKSESGADRVVVVNLASTEPPIETGAVHDTLASLDACIDRNDGGAVRASTLYAYAAVAEKMPYVNFTPSNAALVPGVVELAERNGVPVMGNDGKTGETLVKSALAPMFLCRNLEIMSWEGFNILGNMDGQVLNHPENRESKIRTKDRVLSAILGYNPHSRVHINYVPSLDDQKTAWDFVHFKGFLGAKMAFQFIWQGYDSILAAPLVLDLVRLADFAARRGEGGLMPHLASFFKAPLGVSEHRLYEQHRMLVDYAARAGDGSEAGKA